ncbi:MAG: cobalamin-dependent protein, partial [Candidatus Micrarchaeia archaeon]
MKVLLINNLTLCGHGRLGIPTSLVHLGSMLRKQPGVGLEGLRDVEVAIATVDERRPGMQTVDTLRKHSPDVVGIGVYEQNVGSVGLILERVRAIGPKICTIVGGPFATIMPKTTLAKTGADVLCRGEADFTFRKVIERMARREDALGIEGVMTRDRNGTIHEHAKSGETPILSLAEMTAIEPNRELILETIQTGEYGYLPVLTARGCPFNSCSFCKEGSNWRRLDSDNTKRRIRNMMDANTCLTIGIDDSSFGGPAGKLKELLAAMHGSF